MKVSITVPGLGLFFDMSYLGIQWNLKSWAINVTTAYFAALLLQITVLMKMTEFLCLIFFLSHRPK